MHVLTPLRAPSRRPAALVTAGMIGRLALMLALVAAVSFVSLPSIARAGGADPAMRLRGDVTAKGDVLTLGDLVENAPASFAARPLFRAPALGATGTIQARRILDAVDKLALGPIETGGRVQIQVQRAARRAGRDRGGAQARSRSRLRPRREIALTAARRRGDAARTSRP